MSVSKQCYRAIALAGFLLAVPTLRAQSAVAGTELPVATELQAIIAGLRKVTTEERVLLSYDRICRVEVIHPDCPRNLKATKIDGRLPGNIWTTATQIIGKDAQMGKENRSLRKATLAYVQRPVAIGDSIVMLIQINRNVEDAPRQRLSFDVVLRGDSTRMEVVRSAQRTDLAVQNK